MIAQLIMSRKGKHLLMCTVSCCIISPHTSSQLAVPLVRVHFKGWADRWDTEFPADSANIQPVFTQSNDWRSTLRVGDEIEASCTSVRHLQFNLHIIYHSRYSLISPVDALVLLIPSWVYYSSVLSPAGIKYYQSTGDSHVCCYDDAIAHRCLHCYLFMSVLSFVAAQLETYVLMLCSTRAPTQKALGVHNADL